MALKTGPDKTDPPWQHLKISSKTLQGLESQWSILHLLHHRSHNQHRRSTWYKHFNIFRKQLRLLIDDLDPKLPSDALPSRKIKIYQNGLRNVEKRTKFWADVMIEKWYAGFSQLIGDQQFAVLGITLLAVLGYVVDALRLLEQMQNGNGIAEMKQDLQRMAQNQKSPHELVADTKKTASDLMASVVGSSGVDGGAEDMGEAVGRDAIDALINNAITTPTKEDAQFTAEHSKATSKTESPKKKRRRDADEIDDLFSGLFGG